MQLPLDQSHLKQLRLWAPQSVVFPQFQSSRLTMLGGDTHTIENILPNNNDISSLLWKRSSEDPIPLTSALIQGFDDLHTLCIESSYYWDIRFLAPHLQRLEVLHFTRDQELEYELADVPLLRGLRIFIHSDQHKYKLGYTSMLEQARVRNLNASKIEAKTLVQEWFRQLPRFRAAYFQIANALRVEESFLVWERDRTSGYRMADGMEVWNISPGTEHKGKYILSEQGDVVLYMTWR
ncbi:hypothetical protein D9756_009818 [Leucocoprinus leucothites]|uniref:Uncharacterized protein n=1 Tax=Leucocoprinus leucothites TaxID=201217 RepID=A0A8H5CWL7_9AGAR|nr:hypothetical protein D9756_009818 [Leucoagaricus leucothites]